MTAERMKRKWCARIVAVCLAMISGGVIADMPSKADREKKEITIVASIRPLQWLVEALAPPGAYVQALLPKGQSAHDYALRPADVVSVQNSDLLVWVGPSMEPWLMQLSKRLPTGRSVAVLPFMPAHDHEHPDDVSESLMAEPHIWLDPLQMADAAEAITLQLRRLYPDQQILLQQRLVTFQHEMTQLNAALQAQLTPIQAKGFVVYHDSYGVFVKRYGLTQRGAVWHHEAIAAGPRERAALKRLLKDGSVKCVFYEPEYGRDAVESWLAQTSTGVSVMQLDPLGDDIAGGEGAYKHFMHELADGFSRCLAE